MNHAIAGLLKLMVRHPRIGLPVAMAPAVFFSWIWFADRGKPAEEAPLHFVFPLAFWFGVLAMVGLIVYDRRFHVKVAASKAGNSTQPRSLWHSFSRHYEDDAWVYRFLSTTSKELALWTVGPRRITGLTETAASGVHPTSVRRPSLTIALRDLHDVTARGGNLLLRTRKDGGGEKTHKLRSDEGTGDMVGSLANAGWFVERSKVQLTRWEQKPAKDGAILAVLMLALWMLLLVLFGLGAPGQFALLSIPFVGLIGLGLYQAWSTEEGLEVPVITAAPTNRTSRGAGQKSESWTRTSSGV